jgi:uncharacterized protein (TIGR00369 family)
MSRSLPPYAQLLRLEIDEGAGECRFVMPFHNDVVGRPGYLHGGPIAGLLEFAAFTSLARAIGDDRVEMKPISVTVDYMRGGSDRETFAAAMVHRLGSRVANVEATAWQADPASPIASARLNFLLKRAD